MSKPRTQRREKIRISRNDLRRGQTVAAKGDFVGGGFRVVVLDVEDADEEITLKARVTDYRAGKSVRVGGIAIDIPEDARVRDKDGNAIGKKPIANGSWAKARCAFRSGRLVLRKLSLRTQEPGDSEKIRGPVGSLDLDHGTLTVGPVVLRLAPGTRVRWDAQRKPPAGLRGVRKVERGDVEDERPGRIGFGDVLTVGGELQYELELRDNFDLRDSRRRDRLIHEFAAELELSFDLSEKLFGFVQLSARQSWVGFDEDRDLEFDAESDLKEAFLRLDDVVLPGLSIQVGRQDFDNGREWVMDRQLDAVRLHFDFGAAKIQASVSRVLAGGTTLEEDIVNYLLGVEVEPGRDVSLFAYVLHRDGGSLAGFSLTHLGVSVEAEIGRWSIWGDVGVVTGDDSGIDVEGVGIDVIVMRGFRAAGKRYYVYGGIAFGSGDPDIASGIEGGFRQTGLHDNNDKTGGVTSFRYLGELMRPELSNLIVLTVGVGFRPVRSVSLDVVFHHYEQDRAAPFLKSTRLNLAPSGTSTGIGDELDLVFGLERAFGSLDVEIIVGYFRPGDAFGSRDTALLVAIQIEWNF